MKNWKFIYTFFKICLSHTAKTKIYFKKILATPSKLLFLLQCCLNVPEYFLSFFYSPDSRHYVEKQEEIFFKLISSSFIQFIIYLFIYSISFLYFIYRRVFFIFAPLFIFSHFLFCSNLCAFWNVFTNGLCFSLAIQQKILIFYFVLCYLIWETL